MKYKRLIFVLIVFIILFVFFAVGSKYILFPSDIANYLPGFTLSGWQKVHNSLLADPYFQFEPWRIFAKSRLLVGKIPLWDPYNAGGVPFLANPQTAIFYPLNFFYYFLPINLSLNLIPFLKITLMMFFSYLYFRRVEVSKKSAALGSLLCAFAGFPVLWLLWPHTNVYILFPFLLFLTEKINTSKKNYFYLLLVSFTYFIGVTGGHPETLFHVGILHFSYSLFRLWDKKVLFLKMLFFIFIGFLLSSFLLFPFCEYLLNSKILENRLGFESIYFLPKIGFIYNFFPLILGAPHLEFYKSFLPGINFQELTGGFVGLFVLIITIFGSIKLRKSALIRFFGITIIILIFIIYKIWPFYLIVNIPPVSSIANHRLIGFVGFFIAVTFTLVIDRIPKIKLSSRLYRKLLYLLVLVSLLAIPLLFFTYSFAKLKFLTQATKFVPFLFGNIAFDLFSTITLLILFLVFFKKKFYNGVYFVAFSAILLQTVLFFYNYNSVTPVKSYYPQNEFTKKLQSLPMGPILQVGNIYFPPNINLAYNLSNAQSDDAIGVSSYQKEFAKSFPDKNYLGIVDRISVKSLNKFNILYVLSDYDINDDIKNISSGANNLFSVDRVNGISFKGNGRKLNQIRILTANYNRVNTCNLTIFLKEEEVEKIKKELLCKDIKDNSFLAINMDDFTLQNDKIYTIGIKANNTSKNNVIALRGGASFYLDILFQNNKGFKNLWQKNGIYLWGVPVYRDGSSNSALSVLQNTSEEYTAIVDQKKRGDIIIPKTHYPGWNVYVDGKKTSLKDYFFMKFDVEGGTHLVEIKYESVYFRLGMFISAMAFSFLVFYYFRHFK